MEQLAPPARIFRFGRFEADAARGTLSRGGLRVRLQEQPFRVLIWLLERPGEILTREELRQQLWPEGTYVDFDGSLNVILKKLRAALDDDSDNPRFIETVPRRGYRFITPVMVESVAVEPPPSANGRVLGTAEPSLDQKAPKGPPPLHLIYVATAVVLLVLAGLGWYLRRDFLRVRSASTENAVATVPIPRRSVAVLGFHNLSGKVDDDWLATAFSEMLSTELAAGEKLRLVSGEDVANLRLSSPWSQTDTLGQETTARIGTALNSDVLVLGSYTSIGRPERKQLRLDVRLQDARTGEIRAEVVEIGSSENLFQLISRVGVKLRDRLGVPGVGEADELSVVASLPSNPEAARFYTLGLEKLREFDALAARGLFEKTIEVDPQYALAHWALSEAWSTLGYEQNALEEAKKSYQLSESLPQRDRLLTEGRYRLLGKDWDKALEVYHALFSLFPDDLEYGLRLADAQTQAGKRNDALATIELLRKLTPPVRDDPRIDLAEEMTYKSMGQLEPAQRAALRAAEKAKTKGLDLLLAKALCREAEDLAFLGERDKAVGAAQSARSLYAAAGDHFGASAALAVMGKVQWLRGEYEASEKIYQQVLASDRAVGNQTGSAMALRFLAGARAMRGDLRGAREQYQKALAVYQEIGDREHVAYSLTEIAWVLNVSGEPAATPKLYEQALNIFREMANEDGIATTLSEKGNALVTLGELAAAQEACQQALDLFRKNGDKNKITRTLFDLANIASLQDRLEDSRKLFSEALNIDHQGGDAGEGVTDELGLAGVAEEEGHWEEAKQHVNTVLEYLHAHNDPNQEISADSLLAEIALKEGKAAEAKTRIDAARKLLRPGQWLEERYVFDITDARVQAAIGRPLEAREALKAVVADTMRHNYVHYELEARLALYEVEDRTDPVAAHVHAKALERDARAKGFELIARKARGLEIA
jgi:DNA-binding winged helix-turn-helix (wHTH) protein/tetratricopeptide (TPR) repeat protein/TolB-like protein